MRHGTLNKIVAFGVLTGMRSMAGIATLASGRRGAARSVTGVAALGELIADKTPWVGNRVDPLPLAGRTIIGAGLGAWIAREQHANVVIGAGLGAATAWATTHVAYNVRKHLPLPGVVSGLVEDGLLLTIASRYR